MFVMVVNVRLINNFTFVLCFFFLFEGLKKSVILTAIFSPQPKKCKYEKTKLSKTNVPLFHCELVSRVSE